MQINTIIRIDRLGFPTIITNDNLGTVGRYYVAKVGWELDYTIDVRIFISQYTAHFFNVTQLACFI